MYKHTPIEERLYLRGRIWHFWAYDHTGKQYTQSTKQTDRAAALAVARRVERERSVAPADPAADKKKAKAAGYTLHQAFQLIVAHDARVNAAPNTVAFHRDRARHLLRLLGEKRLCEDFIESGIELVMKYSDDRLEEGADRHTIQKEHRVLRQALTMAKRLGYYLGDPALLTIEGFDQATGMGGFYNVGEIWLEKVEWVDALVEATSSCPDRHRIDRRDDMLVYLNLGLRRREPLLIMASHVNLEKREVTIRMPRRERALARAQAKRKTGLKTDKSKRVLPLNDLMLQVFKRRLGQACPGEPLFIDWGSGNRDLQANWQRARVWLLEVEEKRGGERARAELDEILPRSLTFNDLRRTFCSLMKNAGVSEADCAELLGHEDVEMVKLVYGKTAMATLHAAVAKLPAMRLPAAEPTRLKAHSERHKRRLTARRDRMRNSEKAMSVPEGTARVLARDRTRKTGSEGAG